MKITYEQSKKCSAGDWLRRLILAWLVSSAVEMSLLPKALRDLSGLEGLAQMSAGRMIAVTAVLFILLSAVSRLIPTENAERWMLTAVFAVLAAVSLHTSFTWPFLIVCLLILGCLAVYGLRGWDGSRQKIKDCGANQFFGWMTALFALAFFLLVSVWTVCRVYSFSTPSFDFSIFAQMFHSMRTTGLPITTIERDGPLSHFAVHVSPIYYLLLPFYCLAPKPETLQVLQAAVLASGALPLWKLGKRHGLNPMLRALTCIGLLLYPAYAGGASYDIHENAFLAPLLLWLFYGIDRKNSLITAVFAMLTLLVKEDAAVYVAVVALYLLLRALLGKKQKWDFAAGFAMLAGAVVYFVLVTGYLAQKGDGVMTYRYKNFMYDGSDSLVTVIKAVLLNPMKAVYECVDAEKLEFIGLTLLPLAGLPLLTRRYERFVLLVPYVLVNLMSDYQYQHDIFFQYTYGATACLFYLTLVNLADIRLERRQLQALTAALCIAALCFGAQVLPKAMRYPGYCADHKAYYDHLRDTLDVVPEGASVAATTFYTTYLSQRDVLYDVRYASQEHLLGCEYVALNVRDTKSYQKYGGFEELVNLLQRNGYQLVAACDGKLEIYLKN